MAKTAEIVTAHNVVIQYEMAPIMSRVIASILDVIIVGFYVFLISILMSAFMISNFRWDSDFGVEMLLFYILCLPGFFYSFWMEAVFAGQTVGKMAMGLRVIKSNGENASIGDLFLRWIFRFIDLMWSFGALAIIVALSNEKSQRLGDLVGNTVIIKLRPTNEFSITDILNIKSSKDYEATYPSIVQMTDDDMLLIKNAMDRLKKNPNDAHKDLVRQLAQLTSDKLGLSQVPDQKITFLKTALQDYIVLTRS
ncbi:MAG: RDD family protein [Flavobacteriales bacterium]|nr:RDD family protein [Flavobacteriales bacterium]